MAGSVTQSVSNENRGENRVKLVTFICTGDAANGSIPNTDMTEDMKGWYLYSVTAFPTAGGTAPDAADVFILDENDLDLLGCEDGSTTAYAGLTLIHATLTRKALPNLYTPRAGNHVNFYPMVTGTLTLKVANQATNDAEYTIVLTFIR